jgi:stage II sporulation protein D
MRKWEITMTRNRFPILVLPLLLVLWCSTARAASPPISIGLGTEWRSASIAAESLIWREGLALRSLKSDLQEDPCLVRLVMSRDTLWTGEYRSVGMWLQRGLGAVYPTRLVAGVEGLHHLLPLAAEHTSDYPWQSGEYYTPWLPGNGTALLELRFSGLEPVYAADIFLWANGTSQTVKINDREYRGQLFLQGGARQQLTVINRLPMEDYLLGVVPNEMPASWPLEALKAQALAARSYGIRQMGRHRHDGFDLCSTVHCQAYSGKSLEHTRSSRAVQDTRGEVITYADAIIDAVYHAHSGGHTLNSEYVWGGVAPYLKGVAVPEEPPLHWTRRIAFFELERLLKGRARLFFLQEITISEVIQAGQVSQVKAHSLADAVEIRASVLRSALGSARMRSARFNIVTLDRLMLPYEAPVTSSLDTAQFTLESGRPGGLYSNLFGTRPAVVDFVGEGFGHRVGMSQWGAYGLANRGLDYRAILARFYSGISVTGNYGK